MQLRHTEAATYALYTTQREKHICVHAGVAFPEGAVIGDATAIFFSSQVELMAFLLSDARPNHRRFADRLFKLKDVLHEGIRKTFFGILVGVAGEIMAPSLNQRANVELVLAPAQGLNPDLVKLVAKTRNKQGVAKSAELLLDYGDEFDVLLPLLASGADLQMVGPMDQYMRHVSTEANETNHSNTNAGPQHAAAKPCVDGEEESGDEDDLPLGELEGGAKRQRIAAAADPSGGGGEDGRKGKRKRRKPAAHQDERTDDVVDDAPKDAQACPFENMDRFGQGALKAHREMFVPFCVIQPWHHRKGFRDFVRGANQFLCAPARACAGRITWTVILSLFRFIRANLFSSRGSG